MKKKKINKPSLPDVSLPHLPVFPPVEFPSRQIGWICPICRNSNSPNLMTCGYCGPSFNYMKFWC